MLGRTYLYPFMRFATPDVARDGWNLYAYTGGNPVNYVDPDGQESRAAVMLDQDARELLSGDITPQQYSDRFNARGQGALIAVLLVSPVDEVSVGALALEAGAAAVARLKIAGRIGGFLKKLFGKADGGAGKVDEVVEATDVAGIVAANGTEITGVTRHGMHRAIGNGTGRAGTNPQALLDALRSPNRVVDGVDSQGRPFQVFHGDNARVVVNPETGNIVSMNPLSRAGTN